MTGVSKEFLDSQVEEVVFERVSGTQMVLCRLHLKNKFVVIGKSACLNPDDFDEETGQRIAYDDAFSKLWELYGFTSLQKSYEARPVDSPVEETMNDEHVNGMILLCLTHIEDVMASLPKKYRKSRKYISGVVTGVVEAVCGDGPERSVVMGNVVACLNTDFGSKQDKRLEGVYIIRFSETGYEIFGPFACEDYATSYGCKQQDAAWNNDPRWFVMTKYKPSIFDKITSGEE